MVRRFFSVLHREILGVHEAALLLGCASIGAKVLALLRDHLLASVFGAGSALDIYFSAFRIPDLLYAASFLMTTSVVIIPFFLRHEAKNRESAQAFINGLSTLFGIFMLSAAATAYFLMPFLARWVAPGFSAENLAHLILLSRILLFSPLLLGFSTLVSNVIQAKQRFLVYAVSPILYNAGIIVGIAVFYPVFGLSGLAWGVAVGALLHLLIQIPSLVRLGYLPRVSFDFSFHDLQEVFRQSLPRSVSLGLSQIIVFIFGALASVIGAGSIAVFQLASNLYGIPLGIIGLSYSVAAFPGFARSAVGGRTPEYVESVMNVARHILFWSLPFVALFIVLRAHIVRVILGAGAFGWADTRLTAAALALFSISIAAQGLILLFVRAFHAVGRAALPLVVNSISGVFTVAVGYGLMRLWEMNDRFRYFADGVFRVHGLPQTEILALAFAFSIGSVLNAVILATLFSRMFRVPFREWGRTLTEHGTAAVALALVSYAVLQWSAGFFILQTFWSVVGHGFVASAAGIAAAGAVLGMFRSREFLDIFRVLRRKIQKAPTVISDIAEPSQG